MMNELEIAIFSIILERFCWFEAAEALARLMQEPGHRQQRDQLLHNWVGERQDYTDVG